MGVIILLLTIIGLILITKYIKKKKHKDDNLHPVYNKNVKRGKDGRFESIDKR